MSDPDNVAKSDPDNAAKNVAKKGKTDALVSKRISPVESKVDQILYATLSVIAKGGVDSVTHRKVAEEANLPVGSLTYHFESRDQMIHQAFKRFLQDAIRAKRSFEEQLGGLTLDNLVRVCVETSETDRDLPYWRAEPELWIYSSRDEKLAMEVNAITRETMATFAEVLEGANVPRPMQAAATLQGVISGYELQRLLNPTISVSVLEDRLQLTLDALLAQAK